MNLTSLPRFSRRKPPFPGALAISLALFLPAVPARADVVPVPAAGDVFLGVRAAGGDGSSVSYLIRLGTDATFRNAAPGTSFEVTGLGNPGADLTGTFGAEWYSRADLSWSVFGVRNTATTTVYASRPRTSPATPTAPWPALNSTDRNPVAAAIASVVDNVGGYKGREATVNSPVATFQPNTAEASSYARQTGTPGTSDFGSTSQWTSIEATFANGPAASVLDLHRLSQTSGVPNSTFVGSFTLSSAGVVRFTAPVPVRSGDSDGDGFTDDQEIHAGTDPGNASSFFSVAGVSLTSGAGGGVRVQAPAAANRTYTVQYNATLTGTWEDIHTHTAGAGATPLDFTDSDAGRLALGRGFYRLRIQ